MQVCAQIITAELFCLVAQLIIKQVFLVYRIHKEIKLHKIFSFPTLVEFYESKNYRNCTTGAKIENLFERPIVNIPSCPPE